MNLERLLREKLIFMLWVFYFNGASLCLCIRFNWLNLLLIKLPVGLYCQGQTYREDLPKIPDAFSLTEETIFEGFRGAVTNNVSFD